MRGVFHPARQILTRQVANQNQKIPIESDDRLFRTLPIVLAAMSGWPWRTIASCSCNFPSECSAFSVRPTIFSSFQLSLIALLISGGWTPLFARSPMEAQIARLQKQSPDSPERMEMVRVQIFLDRANFRPGKIDGLGGEFTQKAADRYCRANNLPTGTMLDVSGISAPYPE